MKLSIMDNVCRSDTNGLTPDLLDKNCVKEDLNMMANFDVMKRFAARNDLGFDSRSNSPRKTLTVTKRRRSLPMDFKILETIQVIPEERAVHCDDMTQNYLADLHSFKKVHVLHRSNSTPDSFLNNLLHIRDLSLVDATKKLGLNKNCNSENMANRHAMESVPETSFEELRNKYLAKDDGRKHSSMMNSKSPWTTPIKAPVVCTSHRHCSPKKRLPLNTTNPYLTSHLSPSPVGSPVSNRSTSPTHSFRSLSPGPFRPRASTFSVIEEKDTRPPPPSAFKIPRDLFQPHHGTLSDKGSECNEEEDDEYKEEEERDSFSLSPMPRARSRTCPENRAWKRRVKIQKERARNRPPTPPPILGQSPSSVSLLKEKLHIPDRPLPRLLEGVNSEMSVSSPPNVGVPFLNENTHIHRPTAVIASAIPIKGFQSH